MVVPVAMNWPTLRLATWLTMPSAGATTVVLSRLRCGVVAGGERRAHRRMIVGRDVGVAAERGRGAGDVLLLRSDDVGLGGLQARA